MRQTETAMERRIVIAFRIWWGLCVEPIVPIARHRFNGWFVTDLESGARWRVRDGATGDDAVDGFDFEPETKRGCSEEC